MNNDDIRDTISKLDKIQESSLSRVYMHMQEHDAGFITAFRSHNTRAENKNLNRQLLAILMNRDYGVTSVKGSYIMNHGTPEAEEVGEHTFLVVDLNDTGNLHEVLLDLGTKLQQESVLLVNKGENSARLVGTSDTSKFIGKNEVIPVGTGKYGKVAGEFLSRVRGREFAFEAFNSRNERWAASILEKQFPE
mgnify:FL=1